MNSSSQKRIGLRDYELRDTYDIEQWMQNKEITQWFTFADKPLSDKQIRHFVEVQIANIRAIKPKEKHFVLYFLSDEKKTYIGNVGLKHINYLRKEAQITILISNKDAHGKGYGQEALSAICDYGFNNLALSSISIHCLAHNIKALKAYRRFGFKNERCIKKSILIGNAYHDEVLMSIDNN